MSHFCPLLTQKNYSKSNYSIVKSSLVGQIIKLVLTEYVVSSDFDMVTNGT